MKQFDYLGEVYAITGDDSQFEKNINFKKMTKQGASLGSMLSSLELRGYFESIENGITIKNGKPYPLLTYSFIDYFESHDFSDYHIVEFGSGNSTLYFEDKVKSLTTFETDFDWYLKMKDSLTKTKYIYAEPRQLTNGEFDLDLNNVNNIVIIDSACNRYKLTKHVLSKGKPAFIVLDNSDWYRNTGSLISSFNYFEVPFWGYKNTEHWESCTSLFIRLENTVIPKSNNYNPPPLSRKYTQEPWDNPESEL